MLPRAAEQTGPGPLYIDGGWVETAETLTSLDPSTGTALGSFCVAGPTEVEAAVAAARRAQPDWAALPWRERRRCLARLRAVLLDRQDALATRITREVGKPRPEAITADLLAVLMLLNFYLRQTPAVLRPHRVWFREPWFLGKAGRVEWVPYGVIAAITPWNYPFALCLDLVIPAVAAGNTVVCKPSEEVGLLGVEMAALFDAAGFPPGVVNFINGGPETGRALVTAPVDKVAFTGSSATGRRILADLAKGPRPALMELGGKDPMIVCADADVELAAHGAVAGAFMNCGQVCASVERVYVVRAVAEPFIRRVLALTRRLRVGPPLDHGTDVGPMVSERQRRQVHAQVEDARARGAQVAVGGAPIPGPGFFYPPTVLLGVDHSMAVMVDETFGPVLPIMVVASEEEAVRLAGDTRYGLTASVWTRDRARGRRLAAQLRAGAVMVNDHAASFGSPACAWGGVGESGFGRSHGRYALREFVYPRTLVMDHTPGIRWWWYPYGREMLGFFRTAGDLFCSPSPLRRLRALVGAAATALPFLRTRRRGL